MSIIKQSKSDLKNIGIILAGLLIFWLVLKQLTYPASVNAYSEHMGMYVGNTSGYGLNGFIMSLLLFIFSLFKILLVIGLLVGGIFYLKRFFMNDRGVESFSKDLSNEKLICSNCKLNINKAYKFCPNCGMEIGNINNK